jgi:tRNA uridine 5-carboxymethylaminomethyl modification enzyme
MINLSEPFDVIVVGGGHAGCEAAAVAARMGAHTALITKTIDTIGVMSCNPAIGGIGKGHIVCEIDAFDGLMPQAIDRAGIMFSVLNRKKGPAVQGPRAQADRTLYKQAVLELLKEYPNLSIIEGIVDDCIEQTSHAKNDTASIKGVILEDGRHCHAKTVVITTGTFLRGMIFRGEERYPAGRIGEKAVTTLAKRLESWALPLGRLKTGTPPRLDGRTINWKECGVQKGDEPPKPFSKHTSHISRTQITCGLTATNTNTHKLILQNLHLSAGHSGVIKGTPPRYCPSIEDKVQRFADKDHHQIFLEPEGYNTISVYPNGLANALPLSFQEQMIQTLKGLEKTKIIEAGYAIEYDYVDPRALFPSLALRNKKGLFLAGQINGTTGYEEAAGQGLIAGINAVLYARQMPSFSLSRTESYIGVMIDDLISTGVSEPYRVLTARAEYRLLLRADNADTRLSPLAERLGCLGKKRQNLWHKRQKHLREAQSWMTSFSLSPQEWQKRGFHIKKDGIRRSPDAMFVQDDMTFERLAQAFPEHASRIMAWPQDVQETLAIDCRYKSYILRQQKDVQAYKQEEGRLLPPSLDYASLKGLSHEASEKLAKARPHNLAAARDLEGVTPSAVLILLRHLQKTEKDALS